MEPVELSAAIGRAIRELRAKHGLLQEDIASAARGAGLTWSQATVALLESGRRKVSAEELLLAPLVVAYAIGDPGVDLAALIPDEPIRLGPDVTITAAGLRALAHGQVEEVWRAEDLIDTPRHRRARDLTEADRFLRWRGSAPHLLELAWPGATAHEVAAADADSEREAEQDAARKLEVDALWLSVAAHRLWDRSLTDERDHRAHERAGVDASPRSLQAHRGLVTRELLEELEPLLEEIKAVIEDVEAAEDYDEGGEA